MEAADVALITPDPVGREILSLLVECPEQWVETIDIPRTQPQEQAEERLLRLGAIEQWVEAEAASNSRSERVRMSLRTDGVFSGKWLEGVICSRAGWERVDQIDFPSKCLRLTAEGVRMRDAALADEDGADSVLYHARDDRHLPDGEVIPSNARNRQQPEPEIVDFSVSAISHGDRKSKPKTSATTSKPKWKRRTPAQRKQFLSQILTLWHGPVDQGGAAQTDPISIAEAMRRLECKGDDTVRRAFKDKFGELGYDAYVAIVARGNVSDYSSAFRTVNPDGSFSDDAEFDARLDDIEFSDD